MEETSESWLLKTIYPESLKDRNTYSSMSEYRILYGLRSTLLRYGWRLEDNINQKGIENAHSFNCNAEITQADDKNKVAYKNLEARCYVRPNDKDKNEAYGLLAFPDEKIKSQVQVFWARIIKDGESYSCKVTPKQKIWWSDEGNLLGVSAYLNYIIEYSDHFTQIVGINWPIEGNPREDLPFDNNHRVMLREEIKRNCLKLITSQLMTSLYL